MSTGAFAQSPTILDFSESAEGYNLYMYQSVIRMLNRDKNPDFNMLIRDLDHMRFVTTEMNGDVEEAKTTLRSLNKGVMDEGFEMIMSVDNPDYKFNLYLSEDNGSKALWIGTFLMDGMAGAMEMKGTLDTKYLHAFNSLNMERLQKMLPLDDNFEDMDIDIDENEFDN